MDGVKLTAEFLVRLSSHPGPELQGEVTVISSNRTYRFKTYPEFACIIDRELVHECPHLERRFRSWHAVPNINPIKASTERSRDLWGSNLTFHLRVLFAENHTWQGRVEWLETKRSLYFRSFLELLVLFDEARKASAKSELTEVL